MKSVSLSKTTEYAKENKYETDSLKLENTHAVNRHKTSEIEIFWQILHQIESKYYSDQHFHLFGQNLTYFTLCNNPRA